MAANQNTNVIVMPQAAAAAVAELQATSAVAQPSEQFKKGEERRALPRTLMGGTKAMREAGRTFCPQHPAEANTSYDMRLRATTLYNAFNETVISQSGKFFTQPVMLKDTVPPEIVTLAENIDGQGRALTPYCTDVMKEAFVDGISFVLVDYPAMQVGATLADQLAAQARPYWVLIIADHLIGWRTQNVNGQQVLTQARILECTVEDDGEFGETDVRRVRVLEPNRWRLYEERTTEAGKKWFLIAGGITALPYIPLVPFYVNRIDYMDGAPPLRTLAELNQEHWVSSTEQRRAISFLRFAMLVVSGVAEETRIALAPDKVLRFPNADAKASYVEPTGAGVEAGAKDLKAIEDRMQSAGMELRVENAGRVTATAAAINSAETSAGLMAVAEAMRDSIETALQYTADLLRLTSGGEVDVYDEFGAKEIPGTVTDLTYMRSSGNLSQQSFWEECIRRGILTEDFDIEAETLLIEAETQQQMEQQQAMFEAQQAAVAGAGDPNQPAKGA